MPEKTRSSLVISEGRHALVVERIILTMIPSTRKSADQIWKDVRSGVIGHHLICALSINVQLTIC